MPSTTLSWRSHSISQAPSAPKAPPRITKTTEKPSTKSSEPRNIRPRRVPATPFARSAPDRPVA